MTTARLWLDALTDAGVIARPTQDAPMPRKPAPLNVWIDGAEVACPVVERLGFNHDAGGHAAIVLHDGREQTAVKRGAQWRLWTARDRMRPLAEHVERNIKAGRDPFARR